MSRLFAEIRTFAAGIATLRSSLLHLVLLGAFGIWIPRMKGLDFLDSQVLAAYACLGLIFAGPATAQSVSAESSPSFGGAISRILVGVLYGEIVVFALLGAGIATVYASNRGGYVPTPDWVTLAKSSMFGLGASAMMASLAAWITIQFSRRVAVICLRLAFFGLLVLFFYRGQWLPDAGWSATAFCIAVAGLSIVLLRRICR